MATTSNGIYYPDDGTKVADVLKDMKEMAESIDDVFNENEFDPTEIENNITDLQISQEAQDLAIKNLQVGALDKVTEESQTIEVDDANGPAKLEVLGNHIQDGTPSEANPVEIKCVGSAKKNLFSLENKIENAYIDHFDGILVNDPEYDTFFIEMKEGEDYVLSFKIQNEAMLGALITWGEVDEFPKIGMNLDFGYYYRDELKDMVNMVFDSNKKYLLISLYKPALDSMYDIQFEEGTIATPYVPYGRGSTEIKIENKDRTQTKVYTLPIQKEMLTGDYFTKETDGWKEIHVWEKIDSYNGESITTDYISTTGTLTTGATVYYKLQTAVKLNCTEEQIEVLEQLNNLELFEGINYISTTENIALLKLKYATNKDELAEVKQDISDLQESQTEQDKQLQILTNALPSETQEGESINIKGTIPVKFKEFKLSGNSKQETRSGKNIININSDLTNINSTSNVNGNSLTVEGSSTANFYCAIPINLKPNTDYCISSLVTILEQEELTNNAYIRVRTDLSGSWVGNTITIDKDLTSQQSLEGTFNSGDNTTAYLILYLNAVNDGTQRSAKIKFDNLQIEEGTQATAYEPYGATPSPEYPSEIQNVEGDVNVTVANKNTLKNDIENQTINDVTITKNEGGSLTLNGTATQNSWIELITNLKVSKGDNVLSLRNKISGLGLYLGSEANTDYAVTQSTTTEEKTFRLQENTVFDVVRLRIIEGTVFNNLTVYPMLEKNTIGTDYVPHQEETVTFPLSEGQKLMQGDYLADDGIHHVRKQVELDGTEDWKYYTGSAAPFTLTISGAKSPDTHNDILKSLCNQYKAVAWVGISQVEDNYLLSTPTQGLNYTIFRIKNTDYADVDSFKSYLAQQKQAGTPVIIEYELAEEEVETYTEEQQETYNKLKELMAYEEEINVYSTNEVGPIFEVTAVQNTNAVLTQLKQLILEGGN